MFEAACHVTPAAALRAESARDKMSMGQIGLAKASVLYIGSAVPLETAIGIESVQMPCRERYTAAVGPDMKVAGIDATLTVYSSGINMQVLAPYHVIFVR